MILAHRSNRLGLSVANAPEVPIKLKIVTWNILADRYFTKERYTSADKILFDWTYRIQLVISNILSFDADVICLQEVELATFKTDFLPLFDRYSYVQHTVCKKRSNPIGNVILSKYSIRLLKETTHSIIAQVEDIRIANTHLSVDSDDVTKLAQLSKLVTEFGKDLFLVGDFNSNFSDSFDLDGYGITRYRTCKTRFNWHEFDYIMIPSDYSVRYSLPIKDANIPSSKNPSDHLPLIANIND